MMSRTTRSFAIVGLLSLLSVSWMFMSTTTAQATRTTIEPPNYSQPAANPLRYGQAPSKAPRDNQVRTAQAQEPVATGPWAVPATPVPGNSQLLLPSTPGAKTLAAPQPLPRDSANMSSVPLGGPATGLTAPAILNPPAAAKLAEPYQLPAASPNNQSLQRPNATTTSTSGTARPGDKQLDGTQSPQLSIEKQYPAEVQVGKPAVVMIKVRNSGTVSATEITVTDLIPAGTEFIRAQPAATPTANGELSWSLGALAAGQESQIAVELLPQAEGELGSIASVTMRSAVGGRTKSVRPALTITAKCPEQVLAGNDITLAIKISNPGSGTASNIVLEEHVPAAMKHAGGSELELDVGTLKPGESRDLDLTLRAVHAGRVLNNLTARADGQLRADTKCEFEVIAPALQVQLEGPAKRYLERPATYTVTVANPGTAPAQEIELVANLPRGVKFVKADHQGTYDAAKHRVLWSLEELPAQQKGAVTVTTLPIEQGEHKLHVQGKALAGLSDSKEQLIQIEGVAAILFEVADLADPIEVRGETAYDVRIINQGSKSSTNVQLLAIIPPELKFLQAEGATRYRVEGNRVIFEPLSELPPKSETVYRIRTQGIQPGDVRLKVQLSTTEIPQPITKEESTRVYADE